ncbi:MAG TPA: hypothetical protein PKE64_25650, partial [Anaerolineae bacterium]|nr:hypothetical protein [Anaerolineae bacterium]
ASAKERFFVPDSLPAPHELNPPLTPSPSGVLPAAMAPPPKDGPASVAEWKQMLHSFEVTQPLEADSALNMTFAASLRENWWLAGVALVMFGAALWLTFGQ